MGIPSPIVRSVLLNQITHSMFLVHTNRNGKPTSISQNITMCGLRNVGRPLHTLALQHRALCKMHNQLRQSTFPNTKASILKQIDYRFNIIGSESAVYI